MERIVGCITPPYTFPDNSSALMDEGCGPLLVLRHPHRHPLSTSVSPTSERNKHDQQSQVSSVCEAWLDPRWSVFVWGVISVRAQSQVITPGVTPLWPCYSVYKLSPSPIQLEFHYSDEPLPASYVAWYHQSPGWNTGQ
uniref:Uncharacterized protein n=1 Tax=Timema douglasi TaxID=61478 RepID=A0A7R8W1L0_TIMDO|nr:unnamed protein product [Timema douglasi]